MDWTRWTHQQFNADGLTAARRVYHDIPATGSGNAGVNYDETTFEYDDKRRLVRQGSPDGTILRMVYDELNRPAEQWFGTDDSFTAGCDHWSPSTNAGNMVAMTERVYDEDRPLDSRLPARAIEHVDDSPGGTRVTDFEYDSRDRLIVTDGEEGFYQKLTYDNLDRVIRSEGFDDDETGNLLGREETLYDNRGRVFRTKSYAVDPDTGAVGEALTGDNFYDAAGNLVKAIAPGAGGMFTAHAYDGAGRRVETYLAYEDDSQNEVVVERTTTEFDAAGNALVVTHEQRDTDASTFRASYTAFWHDGIGRRIATANYGTNGGGSFTRPATPPARSDEVLVTTTEYGEAGEAFRTIDPRGIERREQRDDAGRIVKVIESYTDGDPNTGDADEDRVTEFTYTPGGRVETITARNPETGDQVTTYEPVGQASA